jgi:hypothetical protein
MAMSPRLCVLLAVIAGWWGGGVCWGINCWGCRMVKVNVLACGDGCCWDVERDGSILKL